MSWEATAWAAKQVTGSPFAKAVLFALANRHNADTGQCDPSIERIAVETEISKRSVYRILSGLESAGLIARERRAGGHEPGSQTNQYRFPMLESEGATVTLSGGEGASEGASEGATAGSTGTERYNRKVEMEDRRASDPVSADPVRAAFDRYNAIAEQAGLPQAQVFNPQRQRKIKARLADCGGLTGWEVALAKMRDSDWCSGRRGEWRADLDFLLQAKSFTKLMEGSYDNRTPSGQPNGRKSNASDELTSLFASGRE